MNSKCNRALAIANSRQPTNEPKPYKQSHKQKTQQKAQYLEIKETVMLLL
jgi:hypothetical protein